MCQTVFNNWLNELLRCNCCKQYWSVGVDILNQAARDYVDMITIQDEDLLRSDMRHNNGHRKGEQSVPELN